MFFKRNFRFIVDKTEMKIPQKTVSLISTQKLNVTLIDNFSLLVFFTRAIKIMAQQT